MLGASRTWSMDCVAQTEVKGIDFFRKINYSVKAKRLDIIIVIFVVMVDCLYNHYNKNNKTGHMKDFLWGFNLLGKFLIANLIC